jgi:uncharacterized protein YegL
MTLPVRSGATLVAMLVDRSGSMSSSLDEMESGLNSFITDQAALPGSGAVMLAEFDDRYEVAWPMQPLSGAPRYYLRPRGRTALYDAIGRYIGDINERLGQENEYRPVIVVIVTDGAENASHEWDLPTVKEWIKHQREVYGWTFVFLGANLDAVRTATRFGIPEQAALTFDTRHGRAAYRLLSKHVADVRKGNKAGFTKQDRQKAIGR